MSGPLTQVLEYAARRAEAGDAGCEARPVARIDMHCHTTFSDERLRWLPGIQYHPLLEPAETYDLARSRGMDFVTITDHDTIDGCLDLLDRRGDLPDFIVGEEVSARFPEDGTVVHLNVFDHTEDQHREIQRLRGNIHELVAYLRRIDKLYVLNHLTWTRQHRVLAPSQIQAMLELFDVFEGLNGARSYAHNAFAWHATRGHGKVLIGGSDSHTDRVGTTYTLSAGVTKGELLANIRAGRAGCCGEFGTIEKLREDVYAVLQKNVERRLAEHRSRWDQLMCRAFRRACKTLYPLACVGYGRRQDVLIRGFVRALPA